MKPFCIPFSFVLRHEFSISVNCDGENYLSADDLRINLSNLEISDQSFSALYSVVVFELTCIIMLHFTTDVVDMKPSNMEELTEVITAAEFHPDACNLLAYSSSKGSIKLADMRSSALCDAHAKCMFGCFLCFFLWFMYQRIADYLAAFDHVVFEEEEEPALHRSFFSEIIASISDVRFTRDGRYLVSRDYLTLKVSKKASDTELFRSKLNAP